MGNLNTHHIIARPQTVSLPSPRLFPSSSAPAIAYIVLCSAAALRSVILNNQHVFSYECGKDPEKEECQEGDPVLSDGVRRKWNWSNNLCQHPLRKTGPPTQRRRRRSQCSSRGRSEDQAGDS